MQCKPSIQLLNLLMWFLFFCFFVFLVLDEAFSYSLKSGLLNYSIRTSKFTLLNKGLFVLTNVCSGVTIAKPGKHTYKLLTVSLSLYNVFSFLTRNRYYYSYKYFLSGWLRYICLQENLPFAVLSFDRGMWSCSHHHNHNKEYFSCL